MDTNLGVPHDDSQMESVVVPGTVPEHPEIRTRSGRAVHKLARYNVSVELLWELCIEKLN
jgi:hypothetical protein